MNARQPVQVRYSPLHNLSMSAIAIGMLGFAVFYFIVRLRETGSVSLADPHIALFTVLMAAMAYYAYVGVARARDRRPQVVIDRDGIELGFGRGHRFAWNDVQWVHLKRLAIRPQFQLGLSPDSFVAADLRLSVWSLDDSLRPIRGMPSAVLVRDNGLDTSAAGMLDAVRAFRPNLVKS